MPRGSLYGRGTKPHSVYVEEVAAVNPNVTVLGTYENSFTKIEAACKVCAFEWTTIPSNILRGKGCPRCANKIRARKTHKQYVKELKIKAPTIVALEDYVSAQKKIDHRCKTCGHTWKCQPDSLLHKGSGCPKCVRLNMEHSHVTRKMYSYDLGKRKVVVSGYEPEALDWLLSQGVKPSRIHVATEGNVPRIKFWHKGNWRMHYPDIFIKDKNILIEVKSTVTLGLKDSHFGGKELLATMKAKAKYALREGYDYRLLLISNIGTRIKLPKNWFELSRIQIINFIER